MKYKIIIGICILALFISGCDSPLLAGYYDRKLDTCSENSPDQNKYCQCWASCVLHYDGWDDCHLKCKDDWIDEFIIA